MCGKIKQASIYVYIATIAVVLFAITTTVAFAATTGFPEKSIWLSRYQGQQGQQIEISTIVVNSSEWRYQGEAVFRNNGEEFARKNFSVPPRGGAETITTDWELDDAHHVFDVQLVNTGLYDGGRKVETLDTVTSDVFAPELSVTTPFEVAQEITETITQAKEKVNDVLDDVTESATSVVDNLPEPVREASEATGKKLENIRGSINKSVENSLEKARSQLREVDSREDVNQEDASSWWPRTKAIILAVLAFISSSKILFYIALAFVVFIMLKLAWGFFRRNKDDYEY